jgi:hypothetical protein
MPSPTVLAGGQLGLLSRSEVAVAGAAALDLLAALGRVPDPRDPRGDDLASADHGGPRPLSLARSMRGPARNSQPGGRPRRWCWQVDGKTVRGARTGDGTAPHLLACLDHGAGVVLAQVAVDGKTNEITVFTALLAQASSSRGVTRPAPVDSACDI